MCSLILLDTFMIKSCDSYSGAASAFPSRTKILCLSVFKGTACSCTCEDILTELALIFCGVHTKLTSELLSDMDT